MIIERRGNLLLDDADGLVNAVNTVGVMGKGLARARSPLSRVSSTHRASSRTA
jgi:hypothetical protein